MKTAFEILKERFLLIENDKTVEAHTHLVIEAMEYYAKQKLQQHGVSGPASAVCGGGELLATEAEDTGVSDGAGCPHCGSTDLYDVDDHWTKCQDCKFSFVG